MFGFTVIIFSAFSHSLWNVLLKKSRDKYVFNFYMHLVNFLFFSAMYPVLFRNYMYFDLDAVLYAAAGGLFFSLYHLFLSTAYHYSDVSDIYPITTSSPLFIVLWATMFFGEQISLTGFAGIVVTIVGALLLNTHKGIGIQFGKGPLYALLAAFSYSFGAMADKGGVTIGNFILYTYSLCFFMTSWLFAYSLRYKPFRMDFIKREWKLFTTAGIVVFVSFTSFRYGLTMVEVSYAAAIRQVNAIFALILGVLLYKERAGLPKVIATLIIMAGIVLIRIGM
ncbi:EamA family transporter [Limisalsivibrio acetivorans]|uniref:EamA family transporter n=1 Tax=Limisalsivibrio acetivorans TaxID=1304888 RepID=UPI0003B436CC|nr:EamA family transporter [Limisalsivibrio acetivorans]